MMKTNKGKEALRRIRKCLYYTVCLFAAGLLVLCNGRDMNPASISLEGTKWKLAGVVDVETGVLRDLEPKDCTECYTLTFDTNHTASVHSIIMDVEIDLLNLDPSRPVKKIYFDEGYPDGHGHDFRMAIFWAESFTVTLEELKLFYNNKKEYLQFKLIEQ
jgi:hypothetical protein